VGARAEINLSASGLPTRVEGAEAGHAPKVTQRHAEADEVLVGLAQRGEGSAIGSIVDLHAPRLYAVALSLLGPGAHADAEDAVQETLVAAVQRIAAFEGRSSLRTWLGHILVNRVSKLRRSRALRRVAPIPADAAAPPGAAEARLDVRTMLESLSPEHREVLLLRELGGLSYQEIADALSVPRGTVESRLFRARRELRERYPDYAVSG